MSHDYNRVILQGRLTRDPEVRFTPQKSKVARITLASGKTWKDKTTGEKKQQTEFHPVTSWNFAAELLEKYCKKGSAILVEGRLSSRDFDDPKTGQHRWLTEVVAESIYLLGNKGDGAQQGAQPHAGSGYAGSSGSSLRGESGFDDDFPLDFSELGGTPGGDVEIPF